jgi:biopolymer transport protein ExbD
MKPQSAEDDVTVDLTPVIDCVFNLLIFFLVGSQLAQEERELRIELPEAAQAQPLSMAPELIVNIRKEGVYVVDGKELDEPRLAKILFEARSNNPKQQVLIRADSYTAWKYGVTVMGLCNKAKITEYRVAALPQEQ